MDIADGQPVLKFVPPSEDKGRKHVFQRISDPDQVSAKGMEG
jgi:hypothetical protein